MRFNEEVSKVLEEIQEMLVSKNEKYGNSALEPIGVFSKLSPQEGLLIRIDDKLKRIKNGSLDKDDEDVVNDLIGYLVLLKIHNQSLYEPNEALKNAYSGYVGITNTFRGYPVETISNTTTWQSIKEKQELVKKLQQELRDEII
jgi:hypothetical protein